MYAELKNTKKWLTNFYAQKAEGEKERLLRELLPLADNLEFALAHVSGPDSKIGINCARSRVAGLCHAKWFGGIWDFRAAERHALLSD